MGSATTRSNVKEVEQMEQQSTGKMVVPRTFRFQHEKIEVIDFHVFSAASIIGTAMLCMQSFNSYQEYHKD